jgi:hypothetical protein
VAQENFTVPSNHVKKQMEASTSVFPYCTKKGLITYQRYGRGYGLGVTFVKKGIVYGKSCKYMIILIFSYKQIL